jgi:hypothetical protein
MRVRHKRGREQTVCAERKMAVTGRSWVGEEFTTFTGRSASCNTCGNGNTACIRPGPMDKCAKHMRPARGFALALRTVIKMAWRTHCFFFFFGKHFLL